MPEMLPQPMMPTLRGVMGLILDGAQEGEAGASGLRRVRRFVVLDHHRPGSGVAARAPKVAPVQNAGADIGPSVLVLVLSGRRDVLHMGGGHPVAVAVDPLLRV